MQHSAWAPARRGPAVDRSHVTDRYVRQRREEIVLGRRGAEADRLERDRRETGVRKPVDERINQGECGIHGLAPRRERHRDRAKRHQHAEQSVCGLAIHAVAHVAARKASRGHDDAAQHAGDHRDGFGARVPVACERGPQVRCRAGSNRQKADQQTEKPAARAGEIPQIANHRRERPVVLFFAQGPLRLGYECNRCTTRKRCHREHRPGHPRRLEMLRDP